jgi:hypothetical protein
VSNADLAEAIAKLETLSDSRANRVVSLIEDLTELEALENTADLKAARDALAESEKPPPWEQVKAKLDAQFGLPQPTSWEISRRATGRKAVPPIARGDWWSWANARRSGCAKLAGEPDLYRIRVGDYRIIYQVNDPRLTVQVLSIAHRREIYRQ